MIYQTKNTLNATNVLILLNVIMYMVQNTLEYGSLKLGLNIYFFEYGLYHQLLTTMFVHGGIGHILMNMFVLFQFGNMIENHIGTKRFLALYLIGGLLTSVGGLLYMYYSGDWGNIIGASGAISAILGWYALRVPSERKAIIIWIVLISFAPLLLGMSVAWFSHLIGFALGFVLGYII
jgi:membrane associated rhomboid family serine protease